MNKIVGLVGEDPNDTLSVINLLKQKFNKDIRYEQLIKKKVGYQLDNDRTKNALEIEFNRKKPDIVIFIRDADVICTHDEQIKKKRNWFSDLSKGLPCKNILLLNIYELEALIFADIDTFNKLYKTTIKGNRNVMYIHEPKEELIEKTRKSKNPYKESHCPEIFEKLNIDKVSDKCTYFRDFLNDFSKMLG